MDHGDKRLQFHRAFPDGHDLVRFPQGIVETDAPPVRVFLHPRNGGGANAPFRHINDALYRHVVTAVINRFQVGKHVLDFPAGIKVRTAHHVIRNTLYHKPFFQHTRLRVGTIEYRAVPVRCPAVPDFAHHVVRHKFRFVICRIKLPEMHHASFAVLRPKRLVLPACVVADYRIGGIQHMLRGTVVLLQLNDRRLRVYLFKVQDVAYVRPPELVNGLVVVPDHAQVPVLRCQKPYQLKLRRIRILVLVHHDIPEPVLIPGKHFGAELKQLHRLYD